MWFAKATDGFRGWFALSLDGVLRPGADAGDFTVTIITQDDDAQSNPTVSESTQKPGVYFFNVPSAFLVANGSGEYVCVVETAVPAPDEVISVFARVLSVSQEDIDSLAAGMAADIALLSLDVAAVNTAVAGVDEAVIAKTVDGGVTVAEALKRLNAWAAGKIVVTGNDVVYYAADGVTPIIRNIKGATQRTPGAP